MGMSYKYQRMDLDGCGTRLMRCYAMIPHPDYWPAVTDVSCPVCHKGMIRWAEAGYAPGYRICDKCKRHFTAKGNGAAPILVRFTR